MNIEDQLEVIADEAKKSGQKDLAIVLYCYCGAKKAGVSQQFAEYCKNWARTAAQEILKIKNRKNN